MIKKLQLYSIYALSGTILFFLVFLHPIFAVRLFTKGAAYMFFRILSGIVGIIGILGTIVYIYIFITAIRGRKLDRPVLWLQLSLSIASAIIYTKFLIPIAISP